MPYPKLVRAWVLKSSARHLYSKTLDVDHDASFFPPPISTTSCTRIISLLVNSGSWITRRIVVSGIFMQGPSDFHGVFRRLKSIVFTGSVGSHYGWAGWTGLETWHVEMA
ncbi:hypothetical protein PM082_013338 [Marasmius tenuissimus]|nr:hypothetical protein PM082_013338 [Marasmius tenuissimus]